MQRIERSAYQSPEENCLIHHRCTMLLHTQADVYRHSTAVQNQKHVSSADINLPYTGIESNPNLIQVARYSIEYSITQVSVVSITQRKAVTKTHLEIKPTLTPITDLLNHRTPWSPAGLPLPALA